MNYYHILNCDKTASHEELKRSYHELAKKCHPDKHKGVETEDFICIDEAWKVLRDPNTRKLYDATLYQNEINKQYNIYCNLKVEELTKDNENHIYSYVCRCGGTYELDENDLIDDCIVECDECSLAIKITK